MRGASYKYTSPTILVAEQKDGHTPGLINGAEPSHEPALEPLWCPVENYSAAMVAYKYTS